jgi:two-component system chemotaxis response regulator CheY
MRRILKNCLNKLGHEEIVEAGDGLEAQKAIQLNKDAKLALVDWNMPNMNGYEFLQWAKAQEDVKHIPIIMVTTEAEKTNVLMAIKAGAANYVIKPFTPEIIAEKIKAALEK